MVGILPADIPNSHNTGSSEDPIRATTLAHCLRVALDLAEVPDTRSSGNASLITGCAAKWLLPDLQRALVSSP